MGPDYDAEPKSAFLNDIMRLFQHKDIVLGGSMMALSLNWEPHTVSYITVTS